jgi:hypothetical protein
MYGVVWHAVTKVWKKIAASSNFASQVVGASKMLVTRPQVVKT